MSVLNTVIDMSQTNQPGYVHLSNLDLSKFPHTGTISAFGETTTAIFLPYTAERIANDSNIVITSAEHLKVENDNVLVVLGARQSCSTDLKQERMNIAATPGGALKKRKVDTTITPINKVGQTPGNVYIRGLVTFKSCKSYKNGFMCKFRIQDDSGDIGMTAWNDTYEKFDQLIIQNNTYTISAMTIRAANPQYETRHTHEITLKNTTVVSD